ncbi:MAG: CPBP family intramembrane metalloprotease [Lewinellaceae bacterium]|nr:CPBP family intramembrane metalloprotease [Lewinellaceae bacterium]
MAETAEHAGDIPAPKFFEPPEPQVRVVLTGQLLVCLLLAMLGGGLFQLLALLAGWEASGTLAPDASVAERWQMRLFLAIGQLATFVAAGWVVVRFFYPPTNRAVAYLRAGVRPDARLVLLGALLILAAVPLVLFVYNLNQALPLPDVFRQMEEQTTETLKALLRMDNGLELAGNLALIALLPAIGEEIVFRGVVQQQLQRRIHSPWLAILLAAAVFSFIHFQFEGFLPRLLLGVLLGWLYWRTQNFWVPVAAHFANNAVQVIGQFLYGHELSTIDLEADIEVPWYAAILSAMLILAIMRWINQLITHHASPSTKK